jgi:4-amino-4-deoxy-L-arabinose transferase-like glycosyltransferase
MGIFQRILQPRPAGPSEDEMPQGPGGLLRARRIRGLARLLTASRDSGEIVVLIALAGTLNLWDLSRNHWANIYYSAAVRSMSMSWHNFLFASFDPSGVMTVDKPPLAVWIEALSVRAFGYQPLSILVPEALMGVAMVVLLYDLVRRLFGRPAGLIAGVALATTPITVAMSRHNNPDALLTLCCVAALWFLVRAIQEDQTRWIVWSGVMVGLGFETKMAVVLVVVPGIVLAWVWFRPGGWKRAFDQLVAGGLAMLAVGAAWPLFVQLTPPAQRPWIAGTSNNDIVSLILGYNGVGRLAGQNGGPATVGPNGTLGGLAHSKAGAGPPSTSGIFGGASGPFRLLNAALGGQAGWLLGAALAGMLVIGLSTRLRRSDPRSGWILAVGVTLVVTAVLFSVAQGIFHPYYVSLLAPFIAALVGASVGGLLTGRLGPTRAAPLVLAAGVASEIVVLADYPGQLAWIEPLLLSVGGAACLVLLATRERRAHAVALVAALAALLVAPSIWAVDTLGYPNQPTFPAGGPADDNAAAISLTPPRPGGAPAGTPGGLPPVGGGAPAGSGGALPGSGAPSGGAPPQPGVGASTVGDSGRDTELMKIIAFVKGHGGGTIAVSSQQNAAEGIVYQDYAVAGIGGFSGRESNPTVAWFSNEVASGQIRWVYNEGAGNFQSAFDNRPGATTVLKAVVRVCPQINAATGATFKPGAFHVSQVDYARGLFDCAGQGGALGSLAG